MCISVAKGHVLKGWGKKQHFLSKQPFAKKCCIFKNFISNTVLFDSEWSIQLRYSLMRTASRVSRWKLISSTWVAEVGVPVSRQWQFLTVLFTFIWPFVCKLFVQNRNYQKYHHSYSLHLSVYKGTYFISNNFQISVLFLIGIIHISFSLKRIITFFSWEWVGWEIHLWWTVSSSYSRVDRISEAAFWRYSLYSFAPP